jgi:hypothetical protein
VTDLDSFRSSVARIVLASESEPGARAQYRATLENVLGHDGAAQLLAREIPSFPGRLGIQHRDVPYALLNDIADGGIIFGHLATFYARLYPERLRHVAVPAAAPFGQEIAMARTRRDTGPLTAPFERFFMQAARTAYPEGGFAAPQDFQFGGEVRLIAP